jgi:hypothetical protein
VRVTATEKQRRWDSNDRVGLWKCDYCNTIIPDTRNGITKHYAGKKCTALRLVALRLAQETAN